jgi:hypothetical protein
MATTTANSVSTVGFSSNPTGAEIEVDGIFMGDTPANLPLAIGARKVTISKKGFKPYERTIEVLSGSSQRMSVELDAQ